MPKEEIHYKGWRIDVTPNGAGWKAFIYPPGAILGETTIPNGNDRNVVIYEAKAYIDAKG